MLSLKKTEYESYLKKISDNSQSGKFDDTLSFYWLCAQLGLIADKTENVVTNSTDNMGVRFTKTLLPFAPKIRGLLLWRELKRFDVEPNNREDVENIIRKILGGDNESVGETKLSTYADSQMNKYAHGGLKIIKQKIKNPDDLFSFLVDYKALLNEYAKKET